MIRVKEGIDLPIIPEDFIDSEQEQSSGQREPLIIGLRRNLDGVGAGDWNVTEIFFNNDHR